MSLPSLCITVYLFGSDKEVARFRDISRRVALDSEGGLEAKAHSQSQGNN